MATATRTILLHSITIKRKIDETTLLHVLAFTVITTGNAAQLDSRLMRRRATQSSHNLQSQNNRTTDKEASPTTTESSTNQKASTPKPIRCIWVQLEPLSAKTKKENVVGSLLFLNQKDTVLFTVAYNPLDRWTIKGTTQNGTIVTRQVQGPDPLKSIGEILGLNPSQIDTTECAKTLDRWLAGQSNP